jgi:hypothetical protein
LLGAEPVEQKCSRAGCLNRATNKINWRNPKIHGLDRTKTWLGCESHTDYLVEYLSVRGFFLNLEEI